MKQVEPKAGRVLSDETLELLLSRLAVGETRALEQVYELTRASVFGLAFSIVQQSHDAEDVVHDTYVAVYLSAARYEARGKPLAWIFTITKNLALMKLRDRNRHVPMTDNLVSDLAAEKQSLPSEDKLVLQAYLAELKQDEQTIVVLRAVAGWSHREIARFMDMSTQHVIVKYNRAIKKLKRKMDETETSAMQPLP